MDDGVCIYDGEDDSADLATAMEPSQAVVGVIGPDLDEDWYAIEVAEPNWWRVRTIAGSDPDFDCILDFYTPEGRFHTRRTQFNGDLWLDSAGEWSIRVADKGGGGDEDFFYSLTLEPTDGLQTTEPDSLASPSVSVTALLNVPMMVASQFEEVHDEDVILLEMGESTNFLTAQIDAEYFAANQPVQLTLVNAAGETLSQVNSQTSSGLVAPFLDRGPYRLVVDPAGGVQSFAVTVVEGVATYWVEEAEPNDGLTEVLGVSYGGHIQEEFDADGGTIHSDDGYVVVNCAMPDQGSAIEGLTVELFNTAGELVSSGAWAASVMGLEEVTVRISSDQWGPAAWYHCNLSNAPPVESSGDGD